MDRRGERRGRQPTIKDHGGWRQGGRSGVGAEHAAIMRHRAGRRGTIGAIAMANNVRPAARDPDRGVSTRKPSHQRLQQQNGCRQQNQRTPHLTQGCEKFAHNKPLFSNVIMI
jgi:hypothetical protein